MLFLSFNAFLLAACVTRAAAGPIPLGSAFNASSGLELTSRSLEKRFDNARFTFYDAGLGACGKTNSGSDFIVAVNPVQYAGGSRCFETITITARGKTHTAQIVDLCPGCPSGGLDFSRALFTFFAPESVGVITGQWDFGGGGGDGGGGGGGAASGAGGKPAAAPAPSSSKKPKPTPTPAPAAPPAPAPSINAAIATPSSSSQPPSATGTPDPAVLDFAADLNSALVSLSSLVLAAAQSQ